ncbi:MAG: four helix bundle protein [Planctomycetaceae bacterium]|nr:four helix bundle protein [Planctomycetaceae bacterium]
MKHDNLRERTKAYALRIIKMFAALPKADAARTLGKQALRSGTAVAANYREASRARSNAELSAKLGLVEQELDETLLWLELLGESGIVKTERLAALVDETEQLLRMIVAAQKTLKGRR